MLGTLGEVQAQTLNVTGGSPYSQYVTQLFGPGVQVNSVEITCDTLNNAMGLFDATGLALGLDQGLLLTTGTITNAVGPNLDPGITTSLYQPGDSLLDLLPGVYGTLDACAIEMDIVPFCDSIGIRYIFASDEYPEFVGIINDVFGFFISGPGYANPTNIAVVPGTNTPVTINTINDFTNPGLYNDNTNGTEIEYDGYTNVLLASAAVEPCEPYTLRLVIADDSDDLLDSGVFLEAGGISCLTQIPATVVVTNPAPVEGCSNSSFIIYTNTPNDTLDVTVQLAVGGTASLGSDYNAVIPDSIVIDGNVDSVVIPIQVLSDGFLEGTENISVSITNTSCAGSSTISANIEIFDEPVADFNAAAGVCQSQLTTIQANNFPTANYTWNFDGANVVSGSGPGPYQVEWLTPGIKTVCLSVDVGGCPAPIVCKQVEVYNIPNANIAPVADQCFEGNTFNFTYTGQANVDAYFWTLGADASPPSSNFQNPTNIVYTAPGIKEVQLVVLENGCFSDTARFTFEVIPEPSAHFTVADPAVCQSDCIDFTYLGPEVGPNQTYFWDFGANATPQSSTLEDPNCVTFVVPGEYDIPLVVDYKGCRDTFSLPVTVEPSPVLDAGADQGFCRGTGGAQLNATVSGGTTPYYYNWTCNQTNCGLSSPYIPDPGANPTETTTYYLQVEDINGCASNIDSVIVSVYEVPIADAGPDMSFCRTATGVTLQGGVAANNQATPPFSYEWTPATGMAPGNSTIAQPYVVPDTTTIYTLTVISADGCSSMATTVDTLSTVTVDVLPLPIASAGEDTVLCLGDTLQLLGFGIGAGPDYTFAWTPNDALAALSDSSIANPLASPQFTITYSLVVESNGCFSDADQIEVVVNTLPTTSVGPPKDVCLGDSVQLNGLAAGDPDGTLYTYEWIPATGLADPLDPRTLASPDTTTLYYLFAGSEGCRGFVDSLLVEVRSTPIAEILTEDFSLCQGDTAQLFSIHSFTTTQSAGPVIYQWSPSIRINDINSPNPLVSPLQTSIYTLTVSVAGDCPTTDDVKIEVYPVPNAGIVAASPTICSGSATTLTATGGLGSASYSWSPTTGLSDPDSGVTQAFPDTTTTYYVTATEAICANTDSFTLVVNETPTADYFASQASGCVGLEVSFLSNVSDANSIVWDFGDGTVVFNQDNPTHTYTSAGSYPVTLTATGAGGCTDLTQLVIVEVTESNFADYTSLPAVGETAILPNAQFQFTDISPNAVSWLWDFGDGMTSAEMNPLHSYVAQGNYEVILTVVDSGGCSSSITYGPYIVASPTLFIPNVFSPNGDGLYDTFEVLYSGVESYDMKIFDRWGREVFHSIQSNVHWDGLKPSGGKSSEGVYYYRLMIGDKSYQGDVSLFR